jgi:hypothetical protein
MRGGIVGEAEPLNETLRVGLLLETAQAQQRVGEEVFERLRDHLRALDVLVRSEVGRAACETLEALSSEAQQTEAALRSLRQETTVRVLTWSTAAMVLSAAIGLVILHVLVPSSAQVSELRARRAHYASDIQRLRQFGGAVDLRRCGTTGRLCVRVHPHGPRYGRHRDYLLVKGP